MRGPAARAGKEAPNEKKKRLPRLREWLVRYGWTGARDLTLFIGGLLGVLHETIAESSDRPTLLFLFAAMMGLPAFLGGRNGGAK